MIEVDYRAKTLFGTTGVTPEMTQYYESVMNAWVEALRPYLNLERLGGFVVTDNFIEDVLEFQVQQHYLCPRVTNNEMGRALGKTMLNKETGLYTIFLDEQLGGMLLDEEMFDKVTSKFEKDYRSEMSVRRKLAINVLAHELSHVEFETVADEPSFPATYYGEAIHLAWLIADEYYAVRNAAMLEPISVAGSYVVALADTEACILRRRREYNLREVGIDDFGKDFFEFAQLALIYGVSAIADAYDTGVGLQAFSNCRFSAVAEELSKVLSETYSEAKSGKGLIPCEQIAESVISYHRQFEVFASDNPAGLYLDIPVRL